MTQVMIDVRDKDEFDAEHIEHSINIPLTVFPSQAPAIFKALHGQEILLVCRSGKRAGLAAQQASTFSEGVHVEVFRGGILEWKKQGKPTLATKKTHLPIMRQVQLTAGLLVLISSMLAVFVDFRFVFVAAFVGTGLTVAGATGFCGMAELLALMPWNKAKPD